MSKVCSAIEHFAAVVIFDLSGDAHARRSRRRVAADAPNPNLCGGVAATHAILANGAGALSVFVFSGADAPGPNAHDTQLCGIFNYTPLS